AAQARLVRAAVGRGNRVAIGGQESVAVRRPRHRPLRSPMYADLAPAAGEDVRMDQRGAVDRSGQILFEPVGEMEGSLLRYALDAAQKFLGARPADLHAAEQISLERAILNTRSGLKCAFATKMSGSGRKRTLVPRRLGTRPSLCNLPFGLPRSNSMRCSVCSRATSTSIRSDSALVTETPTPCKPPDVPFTFASNFPPACKVHMITSRADLFLNFGCGSTGIPRPLSVTVTKPSASISTSMKLAWPASASSMELSITSAKRWCSAFSSVPPIYMPGRRRTGSSPSSTSMSRAV